MTNHETPELERTCYRGHIVSGDNAYNSPNGSVKCRSCRRIAEIKYNDLHLDRRRASARKSGSVKRQNMAYRKYIQEKNKEYRARNPIKARARRLLQQAVFRTRIIRPDICDKCCRSTSLEAHHYDYSRAFDVLWLCKQCHEWLHHTTVGELSWTS